MTTDKTQGHRPSSRSVGNLIILQVNLNGIENKLEELKLLIHVTYADIITFQETRLTPKSNTPKVHNFTTVRANMLHKAGLTTLSISQLQTFIYLLETAHSRTTKQLTRIYNAVYSTSQTYHTQFPPEM